jgi:hypothetical protein
LPAAAGTLVADDMVYEVTEGEGRRRRLEGASWLGSSAMRGIPDTASHWAEGFRCQAHGGGSKSAAQGLHAGLDEKQGEVCREFS